MHAVYRVFKRFIGICISYYNIFIFKDYLSMFIFELVVFYVKFSPNGYNEFYDSGLFRVGYDKYKM
jgi:hypothetical protein